jgi:hypothetical protein
VDDEVEVVHDEVDRDENLQKNLVHEIFRTKQMIIFMVQHEINEMKKCHE